MSSVKLTRYAMVIAIDVCLNMFLGNFSFGIIQFRISELLMLLCLFDKGYTYALTIGCLLSNLIGLSLGMNVLPLDFIFGTIATYISCLLMIKFKDVLLINRPLVSLLIPSVINGIIIGLELAINLAPSSLLLHYFLLYGLYVFVGELLSFTVLGFIFYESFRKYFEKINRQ